jgi:hypothetical protein
VLVGCTIHQCIIINSRKTGLGTRLLVCGNSMFLIDRVID